MPSYVNSVTMRDRGGDPSMPHAAPLLQGVVRGGPAPGVLPTGGLLGGSVGPTLLSRLGY